MKKFFIFVIFALSFDVFAGDYTIKIAMDAWLKLTECRELYNKNHGTNLQDNQDFVRYTLNPHLESLHKEKKTLQNLNENLEKELNNSKSLLTFSNLMLGIIIGLFTAFVFIKKCQAKKLPKKIEEAIAQARQ